MRQRFSHNYDCFICYAGEDRAIVAQPLAETLHSRGYKVWFDQWELSPGDSILKKINQMFL